MRCWGGSVSRTELQGVGLEGRHLGQTRVGRHLADILVLGHQPGQRAVKQLDLRDGVGLAEVGELGRDPEGGRPLEGEAGGLGAGHGGGVAGEEGCEY